MEDSVARPAGERKVTLCWVRLWDRLSGYYLGFPRTHKFGMSRQTLILGWSDGQEGVRSEEKWCVSFETSHFKHQTLSWNMHLHRHRSMRRTDSKYCLWIQVHDLKHWFNKMGSGQNESIIKSTLKKHKKASECIIWVFGNKLLWLLSVKKLLGKSIEIGVCLVAHNNYTIINIQ